MGKTGTLDLSASFTHTYDGHYNDYCGAMIISIPESPAIYPYLTLDAATSTIVTSAPYDASQIESEGVDTIIYVYLPNW